MSTVSVRVSKIPSGGDGNKSLVGSLKHHLRVRVPKYINQEISERGSVRIGDKTLPITNDKAKMEQIASALKEIIDEKVKTHKSNAKWKPYLDNIITFSPDSNQYPSDAVLHQMAKDINAQYLKGKHVFSAIHRDEKTIHVHFMGINEGSNGKALPIKQETLSELQTYASNWLQERGYEFDRGEENYKNGEKGDRHLSVRESHAVEAQKLKEEAERLRAEQEAELARLEDLKNEQEKLEADIEAREKGKAVLDADLARVRTEREAVKDEVQQMQEVVQETSLAVGIYGENLKRPEAERKSDFFLDTTPEQRAEALTRAQEYTKQRKDRHPGWALLGRLLQRKEAQELLMYMLIIAPAVLVALIAIALAVRAVQNAFQFEREAKASAQQALAKQQSDAEFGRELEGMVQQVREPLQRQAEEARRPKIRESDDPNIEFHMTSGKKHATMFKDGVVLIQEGNLRRSHAIVWEDETMATRERQVRAVLEAMSGLEGEATIDGATCSIHYLRDARKKMDQVVERVETVAQETKKEQEAQSDRVVMEKEKDGFTARLYASGAVEVLHKETGTKRLHRVDWEAQPTQEIAVRALTACIEGLNGRQRGFALSFLGGDTPEREYTPITGDMEMGGR